METQRNADDGISAESVNEKAKQGGQGEEKLSSCFCCGGDTGKSGSIRPLLIAVAAEIVGNLADRQIVVRAQILQSLIFHDSSPLRKMLLNGRIKMAESYHTAIAPLKQ